MTKMKIFLLKNNSTHYYQHYININILLKYLNDRAILSDEDIKYIYYNLFI